MPALMPCRVAYAADRATPGTEVRLLPGAYGDPDAARYVVFRDLGVEDIGPAGNRDCLKLSGLDDFEVLDSLFRRCGDGGSGIDMVGCHDGLIRGNLLEELGSGPDANHPTGVCVDLTAGPDFALFLLFSCAVSDPAGPAHRGGCARSSSTPTASDASWMTEAMRHGFDDVYPKTPKRRAIDGAAHRGDRP